jgi:hypothetical protein
MAGLTIGLASYRPSTVYGDGPVFIYPEHSDSSTAQRVLYGLDVTHVQPIPRKGDAASTLDWCRRSAGCLKRLQDRLCDMIEDLPRIEFGSEPCRTEARAATPFRLNMEFKRGARLLPRDQVHAPLRHS